MTILIVYVLLVALFEGIVCFVGMAIDTIVPSGWNLIVAISMFFIVLAVMWPVSVYITERWLTSPDALKDDEAMRRPAE
jgi:hypothetical protein